MSGPSIEERFKRFLSAFPGAESIDATALPEHGRKADYLLAERRVILELKTLTVDTSHKVDTEMARHRDRREFPLFFGQAPMDKILRHLPDGEAVKRRIYFAITRSVEGAVRSAEEQIAHTRSALGLPDALGLLVMLNESIDVLDPNVVAYRVAQVMRRTRTGKKDYPTIHFACMLFESHVMSGPDSRTVGLPCVGIRSKQLAGYEWFDAIYSELIDGWARFNGGRSASRTSPPEPNTGWFSSRHVLDPPPTKVTRQQLWEREYAASPYLRHLADDAVLAHGGSILRLLTPYFLKGGPGFVESEAVPLMEKMAHFQVEAQVRGLDWRKIPRA